MKLKLFGMALLLTALAFIGCDKKEVTEENTIEEEIILPGEGEIAFSKTGYFYSKDIKLELLSSEPCKIYYTMDGTDPSEEKKLYNKAINLDAGSSLKAYCVKAKGYFEDGTESETIVHTFFMSKQIEDRFDTLVFSVTTDPYNLYDDEYGIFVEGKLREDYIKNNPHDKIEPNDPANFNMRGRESEREVYLEVFEPNGTKIAGQAAGIRTYGGWSRANLQKSIKIFARKEYDELNNKLRYEFFPSKTAANGDGTLLTSFKRLVLRNSGNDNGFAFIRDELFQTLAAQAGYIDYQAVRPAVLFVNGDYRGFFWLHEVYCDEYFEDNYGDYTGEFQILEGGETYKKADEDGENEAAIKDYEALYAFADKDLTDDQSFRELSELMDVENYLSYYALQIYIGNEDWPHNNYKTYRYYAAEEEDYREAPFDGKWRYLLHDLDFSFGIYGTGPYIDNINTYIGKNGEVGEASPLFGQLMKREDCREIFIKKTMDLINGAFAPENINSVLEDMNASRMKEQVHMYGKYLLADWVQLEQLEGRLEDIRMYGTKRAEHILTKYKEHFGLGTIYRLEVQPAMDCEVKINSFRTKDFFEGNYYSDYNTVLSSAIPAGKEFDCWLVNGVQVKTEELVITPSMVQGGTVEVILMLKENAEDPHLIISELSADGDMDYILLYNPYEMEVSTEGYFVTDDVETPMSLPIPALILAPGEGLKILCERNTDVLESGQLRAEFNLKTGESVLLYRLEELIDTVEIPELKNGNIYQRELSTMRFYEISE